MTKILNLGIGPLPSESADRLYATGLRLWNFSAVLAKDDHQLIIGEAYFSGTKLELHPEDLLHAKTALPADLIDIEGAKFSRHVVSLNPERAAEEIKKIYDKHKPDCVVSNTEVLNLAVALAGVPVPKWFDFNGDPMAERQLQAWVYGSDEGLLSQWEIMVPALLCGDHFSTCSLPQKFALVGQLGVCGRLNKDNVGTELVDVLPPGSAFKEFKHSQRVIRGKVVPEDAFVVLWNGGYNTWTDIETLYRGLDWAMGQNDKVHYVSTGGAISGHDDKTFDRFLSKIKGSAFANRFHFVGWVPTSELPDYYFEADAAINIDFHSYEGLLGCRNRLFSWIIANLPIITTALSEITELLTKKGLAAGFPLGDYQALGKLMLDMSKNPSQYKQMAEKAHKFLLEEYTNDKLLQPLRTWAQKPRLAPDIARARQEDSSATFPSNALAQLQLDNVEKGRRLNQLAQEIKQLKAELYSIRQNRLYKLYKKIFG